jgi:hypothetical protein
MFVYIHTFTKTHVNAYIHMHMLSAYIDEIWGRTSLWICLYVHIVYMFVYTCLHTYVRTYMHTYVRASYDIHTYVRTHCVYVCVHTCIHKYLRTCIHTYAGKCMQTYTHAYYMQRIKLGYAHMHGSDANMHISE